MVIILDYHILCMKFIRTFNFEQHLFEYMLGTQVSSLSTQESHIEPTIPTIDYHLKGSNP